MSCVGCGFEILADFAFCPRCGRRQPVACAAAALPASRTSPSVRAADRRVSRPRRQSPRPANRGRPPAGHRALRRPLRIHHARPSGSIPRRCARSRTRCSRRLARRSRATTASWRSSWAMPCWRCSARRSPTRTIPSGRSTRRSTCCARATALSEQWAARLGQPVTPAHRRPHRPGRGRQPRRCRGRRLRGDRRHGEHDAARLLAGGARAPSWCPRPPTRSRGIASRSSRPASWRCAARRSRSSSTACSARWPSRDRRADSRRSGSRRRWSGAADELDQLLAAFERMQRGRAQVVSLVGEAGTGKSRLIAEFLRGSRPTAGSPARPCAARPARRWASRPTASSARSSAKPTGWTRTTRSTSRGRSWRRACSALGAGPRRPRPSRRC